MIGIGSGFYFEPQLQAAHAFFKNKILVTDDATGQAYDESVRLDRKYNSIGFIGTISYVQDTGGMRLKFFLGLGYHNRWYKETQYEKIIYRSTSTIGYPEDLSYTRAVTSFHFGIEVGLPF